MKKIALLALMAITGYSASAQYEQAKLKYSYTDLEPPLDSTTLRLPYPPHHPSYVTNLNKTLESYPDLKAMPLMMLLHNIGALPLAIQTSVRNNGGGVYNHNLYFEGLTTPSNSVMPNELKEIIEKQFESIDKFKAEMENASISRFGSGWTWLLVQPNGTLTIVSTANQDAPFMDVALTDGYPILNVDVWEHAYYLKYRNKRNDYLTNLWNVIDWKQVYSSYLKVMGK